VAFSKYGPTMWQGPLMDAFVAGWSKEMHRDRVPELFSIQRTTRHAWRDQRLPKDPAQRLSDPKSAGTYQPAIEPRFGYSVHTPCPAGE
jgi:hypothetical protein